MWMNTILLAICLVASSGSARAQFAPSVPLGPEFQVNTYTTSSQVGSAVAIDAAGSFIVWGSFGQDGSSSAVVGRRYAASGTALGPEFVVNTFTTGIQSTPSIAEDGVGNFIVVWTGDGQDGSGRGVFGQRFTNAGAHLGSEFQVNTFTTNDQYLPTVDTEPSGNFVVTWISKGQDGNATSIEARRYASNGSPLGPEFQVNTYTTGYQLGPSVSVDPSGNFVVVWASLPQDGSSDGVYAQRYTSAGVAVGPEFQVNTYTTNSQSEPAVITDAAGNFVVTWRSYDGGTTADIVARRYASDGTALSPEFLVNTYTTGSQQEPALAIDGAGNFVVVWNGASPDGSTDVLAQRFDSSGTPTGGEFLVNSATTFSQSQPEIADDGAGNFVVTWSSFANGVDSDVAARRFATGRTVAGKKLLVKAPGAESTRRVVAVATETGTDVGSAVLGDPVADGGTLRVIMRGTTASDQTYVLDAAGWRTLGAVGFRYDGPTGADGDPVKRVIIKRTPSAKALLKAVLAGSLGTQSLDVVPPNMGDTGGIILSLNAGGTYCVGFGGAAGGTEVVDNDTLWKVIGTTAQPGCPTTP